VHRFVYLERPESRAPTHLTYNVMFSIRYIGERRIDRVGPLVSGIPYPNSDAAGTQRFSCTLSKLLRSLVPETGLEPVLPCGKRTLSTLEKGGESIFIGFVALSRLRGLRGVLYSPRVMDTQMDTRHWRAVPCCIDTQIYPVYPTIPLVPISKHREIETDSN
jgi:hypothetical protein